MPFCGWAIAGRLQGRGDTISSMMISLALLILLLSTASHGQDVVVRKGPSIQDLGDGWYEAIAEAYVVNITPEEARRQALDNARNKALAHANGIDIQGTNLLRREEVAGNINDVFYSISQQTHGGRIVEERVPVWEWYTLPADPQPPIQVYRVRVQVKVESGTGVPDPDFAVSIQLNKDHYRSGEEMEMAITATKPCHLTLFCLTATDTVVVLLPHKYRQDRQVNPGDTLYVPDAQEKQRGIRYKVFTPLGRTQATETIKVIATKQDYTFGAGRETASIYTQIPTYQDAYSEMLRWLMRIPRNERAEAQVTYIVIE